MDPFLKRRNLKDHFFFMVCLVRQSVDVCTASQTGAVQTAEVADLSLDREASWWSSS